MFKSLATYGIVDIVANLIVYALLATVFFAVFWVIYRDKFRNRRIQQRKQMPFANVRKEILNSCVALLVFTVIDVIIYAAQLKGYTKIYSDIDQYGWPYLCFSVVAMILLHDTWFYFTHRLMHHPKIYKHVHKVHHLNADPSPFAALSIHPFEVMIDAGIFVVFAFSFPLHVVALWTWQVTHLTLNVIGHLGYEIYPKGFNTHWLFKFKTPTTHHNMHHEKSNGNYGLYFTWWDRIFKTEFKNYNDVFNAIHERVAETKQHDEEQPLYI